MCLVNMCMSSERGLPVSLSTQGGCVKKAGLGPQNLRVPHLLRSALAQKSWSLPHQKCGHPLPEYYVHLILVLLVHHKRLTLSDHNWNDLGTHCHRGRTKQSWICNLCRRDEVLAMRTFTAGRSGRTAVTITTFLRFTPIVPL